MTFVDYVKYYLSQQDYDDEDNLKKAINLAIDRCIEEGVLEEFLRENRSEVVKVTQMDYTFDRQIIMEREAGREEGRQAGEDIKAIELIRNAMNNTSKSFEEVCDMLGIATEDMNRYQKMI